MKTITSTALLDIHANGVAIQTLAGLPETTPWLQLPQLAPTSDGQDFSLTKEALDADLIIFGMSHDPFFPFTSTFERALKLLELLAEHSNARICVQTRSPLIVLALPLLRSIAERLVVSIALEGIDDSIGSRLTPGLPRAEERIKAARTLRNFGITTVIQACPLSGESGLLRFAKELLDCSNYITIPQIRDVLSERTLLHRPELCGILRAWLGNHAEEKLAEDVLEVITSLPALPKEEESAAA